jgi:hypothetical protein
MTSKGVASKGLATFVQVISRELDSYKWGSQYRRVADVGSVLCFGGRASNFGFEGWEVP